jgi:iron complex outermembrane recepter protein
MKQWTKSTAGAAALGIALAAAQSALAQTTPAPATSGTDEIVLDDIIVTAQKRPERLQETPLAITAFSQSQLDSNVSRTLVETVKLAPGVSFTSGNTARAEGVRIRGVGTASFSEGVTGSVATVVDGVVLGRQAQGQFELNDIEQIEVLRGPQGTLYGASATAGVINIVTQRPSDEMTMAADLQYGNFDEIRARATVSGPIVGEIVKARLSAYLSRRDGEITNVVNGVDLNNRDEYGFRGKIEVQATPELNLLFSGDYTKSDTRCCSLTFRTATVPALVAPVVASTSNRQVALDAPATAQRNRSWGLSMQADYDFASSRLTSITAYRNWRFSDGGDSDFTASNVIPFAGTNNQSRQFSQELRIASTGDQAFNYIAGLFYFDQKLDADSRFDARLAPLFVPPPTGSAIGTIRETAVRTVKQKQYAAFVQLDYKLTDQLKLIGGLRATKFDLGLDFTRTNTNPLLGTITGAPFNGLLVLGLPTTFSTDNNDSNLSGKVGLQFQPTRDLGLYASYTRGYKGPAVRADSGDPIAGADVAVTARIAPETVDAFEAGLRSQFLDRRLTVNLTGFYSKFKNFQANTVNPANPVQQSLVNAGDVSTRGVELEVAAKPAQGLTFGGSLAYVDARYGNILVSCSSFRTVAGCTPSGAAFLLNLNGQQFQNAPRWTAALNAGYETDISENLSVFIRGDMQYRSKVFFSFNRDPLSEQQAYTLFNANVGVKTADDHVSLTFYMKNISDKDYGLSIARSALTPGSLHLLGLQRSYGAVLGYKF